MPASHTLFIFGTPDPGTCGLERRPPIGPTVPTRSARSASPQTAVACHPSGSAPSQAHVMFVTLTQEAVPTADLD